MFDKECSLSSEQLHVLADKLFESLNEGASKLVRLFLVQDMIESLKV